MANAAPSLLPPPDESQVPIAPSAERWREMSAAERDAFLDLSLAALQHEATLMGEGSPHITARVGALEVLRDHFSRAGRNVYLRSELPVHYPGERVFAPDLMAVLDVEDGWYEDPRMAWVVAQEGRGLDLVLEILHRGDPRKDLLDNVQDYARMGIPEYFVYDRRKVRVLGYRLSGSTGRYDPIKAHGGMLFSRVLGLELGIIDGRLRFSQSGAVVPETREILQRVNAMMNDLESREEESTRRVETEVQARQEAERRADAEATARQEAERRADAEAAAREALERQIAVLRARLGES